MLGHAKTVPYEELLKTVGMLNLSDRRIRQSLIYYINASIAVDLNTFVTFSIIGELTTVWEEMDLILPYLSLTCNGKKVLFVCG